MTATPVRPPSTSITVPWTNKASSLARYTAAWAMASGVPLLPAGVPRIIDFGGGCGPVGPIGIGGADHAGRDGVDPNAGWSEFCRP